MQEREGFIAGVPCWIDSGRRAAEPAVTFYGGLFGWEFTDIAPAEEPGEYLLATIGGKSVAAIGVGEQNQDPPSWNTYVQVDDADVTAKAVFAAGGRVLAEPFDVGEAGRMATFADPAGAVFSVWQPGSMPGAALVNDPGSWNSSDLYTPDVAEARAFYGAVFGWEAGTMEYGGHSLWLFRLPGYGDFLEQYDPEIRARNAEFGAPPGFEDAVGWMEELGDQPAAAGRTGFVVTFGVADTDATVARCRELGGTVRQEPVTIGPVRAAVLADPEGAVFAIGQFTPEGS